MKKLWILLAAVFLFINSAYAQTNDAKAGKKEAREIKKEQRQAFKKLPGNGISVEVKQAFAGDFGNQQPTWERTDIFDIASFTGNGHKMTAYYDADARLIGTTVYKTFTDLPAKAQQTINSQYGAYTKGMVIFFDDNETNETDMMLYNIQFDDMDCYFMELSKDSDTIVLQITTDGRVSSFTQKK